MSTLFEVLVPTAVSSFFTIEGLNQKGEPEVPLQLAGARGGGFKLSALTRTRVKMTKEGKDSVYFNSRELQNTTTHKVIDIARESFNLKGNFEVFHEVHISWGSGFGTSASTALGAAIAILYASGVRVTLKKPSQIAHEAEILAHTGLGTVGSLYSSSGCGGLITRAGGPGICELEPFVEDYSKYQIVATTLRPREKAPILTSKEHIIRINRIGSMTLERILVNPTARSMLRESRRFAEETGIMTEEVREICDLMMKNGAIASTQNMIGDAAHCVIDRKKSSLLAELLKKEYPAAVTCVCDFYEGGPRIVSRQQ